MKQHLFYISLALLLSACGENSSPPQNIPATPSQPITEGAPVADTLRPKVEGSCDGNTTISLYVDDQPVTPAVGCDNGVYAIVPDAELTHANHCFSTEATNADGVNSERSERTCAFTGRPFTTVWKTDNGGVTQGNQIRITPVTNAYAYNYSVEWGDGTEDMNLTDKAIHTYPAPGVYTVKINGIFPQFDVAIDDSDFGGDYIILTLSDRRKLIAVSQRAVCPGSRWNTPLPCASMSISTPRISPIFQTWQVCVGCSKTAIPCLKILVSGILPMFKTWKRHLLIFTQMT